MRNAECGMRNAECGCADTPRTRALAKCDWLVVAMHATAGSRSEEWCYRKCGIRNAECGIRNEENCFVAYGNNSYQTRSDIARRGSRLLGEYRNGLYCTRSEFARRGSRLDEFFLIFGEHIGNIRFGHDKIHIIKSANGVKIWRADLLRV